MPGLVGVGDSLTVASNARLANIDGLVGLETVGTDLEITDNASLTSVDAITSLESVGSDVRITDNASLCQSAAELAAAVVQASGSKVVENNGGDCP